MRLLAFFLALIMVAAPATAQQPPARAPIPDWVVPVTLAEPNPALSDRPYQALLINNQSRYEADRHDHFTEMAFLIQSAQGLQGLGNISLPWQPDQSELIVHKVHILRDGAVIDLLANGQEFAVLRRENNLESAVLDGVLTAVMQAEGLQVGDVLDVAFSLRRRGGELPLRGENLYYVSPNAMVGRFYARQFWTAETPLRWRAEGSFASARERAVSGGRELVFDLRNVEGTPAPAWSPPRYQLAGSLQLTQYRDWAEVAGLLAPHYERAATLAAESPLRAQIDRIAAASTDPGARAMAALRLVQDQVRYFALVMGDGNYLPASADQTWTRRYGDCKGKTALLLALLRGLGIEAEPFLVSTALGDSLDQRLPQMSLFNHVLVRARIGGRSYWLDGTRMGDRNLGDLASSTLGWGLPVLASDATLVPLPYAPPQQPLLEVNVAYDATEGFVEPVGITLESIYRGDGAVAMRTALSQIGREAFVRQVREASDDLPGEDEEVADVDLRDDPEAGTFAVIVRGRTRMEWRSVVGAASRRFRFDDGTIRWDATLERSEGRDRDAPFAFGVPSYFVHNEIVLLPNGGRGFSLDGRSFDHVVAGTRIARALSIEGNRAVARSTFQRLEPEVSAAVARSGKATLEAIGRDEAYLRAPPGTQFQAAAAPATPSAGPAAPADAEALVDSGYQKLSRNHFRDALADFDRAIAIAPEWSVAHANRGIALTHLDRYDEAERALFTALRLDQSSWVVHQGLGYLDLRRGRPEAALRALNRSVELSPENLFTLGQRVAAFEQLGRFDDALADIERMLAIEPRNAMAMGERARIHAHLGREAEALAAIDQAIASDPGNYGALFARAELLERFHREAEATAAYQTALAAFDRMAQTAEASVDSVNPVRLNLVARAGRTSEAIALLDEQLRRFPGTIMLLAARCAIRTEANIELEQALRDCNEALEAEPGHPIALPARASAFLRLQRWTDAARDFGAVIDEFPAAALPYYGRAIARTRLGDADGAASDVAAARRLTFDIDVSFIRLGFDALPAVSESAAATPAN